MKCPACKMYDLTPTELETNLTAFTCSHCNGNWIRDVDYKMWRTAHGEDLPEKTGETTSIQIGLFFRLFAPPMIGRVTIFI